MQNLWAVVIPLMSDEMVFEPLKHENIIHNKRPFVKKSPRQTWGFFALFNICLLWEHWNR
jgi:1,4-alpha-glucan branching enzyme